VCKGDLARLRRHRFGNLSHAVPNIDDGRLPRGVQKTPPIRGNDPTSFAAHRNWKLLAKIPRK
jgi:hypothetical protein